MPVKTGAKRHTHKYHKVNGLWSCALGDCTHYMPKNVEGNIKGKLSICWSCENEFNLDPEALNGNMPTCFDCRDRIKLINERLNRTTRLDDDSPIIPSFDK